MAKFVLAVITLSLFAIAAFLIYRAVCPTEPLEYEVGKVSVNSISKTGKLKVVSFNKELLVSQHRISSGYLVDSEQKIYVIYPATMHLGFDLSKCNENSITVTGDSVHVVLPPVEILNRDGFTVDEAEKRTAIEEGEWSAQEMTTLRRRAEAMMVKRCEEDGCYERAERQGRTMVAAMMANLGYGHVSVDVMPRADYGYAGHQPTSRAAYLFYTKDQRPFLAYKDSNGKNAPRLFYYRKNLTYRQLLRLADLMADFFDRHRVDAEVMRKNGEVLLYFYNTNGNTTSSLLSSNGKKDMGKVRDILHAVFGPKTKVTIQEIDAKRKIIRSHLVEGRATL